MVCIYIVYIYVIHSWYTLCNIYIRVCTHIYMNKMYIKQDGTIWTCILGKFNYSCTATAERETNKDVNITEDAMQ